jgi:hypothetical protein
MTEGGLSYGRVELGRSRGLRHAHQYKMEAAIARMAIAPMTLPAITPALGVELEDGVGEDELVV